MDYFFAAIFTFVPSAQQPYLKLLSAKVSKTHWNLNLKNEKMQMMQDPRKHLEKLENCWCCQFYQTEISTEKGPIWHMICQKKYYIYSQYHTVNAWILVISKNVKMLWGCPTWRGKSESEANFHQFWKDAYLQQQELEHKHHKNHSAV